jgi:hypothetical protein
MSEDTINQEEIYQTRELTEEETEKVRGYISKWANGIPHHDHSDLGKKIRITKAVEIPAYDTQMLTQYERRTIEEGAWQPLSGQIVPANAISAGTIDPWSYDYPVESGFAAEEETTNHNVEESRVAQDCGGCGGEGKVECHSCGGQGQVDCSNCDHGRAECPKCAVDGIKFRRQIGNPPGKCPRCSGTGDKRYYGKPEEICDDCRGKGICLYCEGKGEVQCDPCGGRGVVTCDECRGSRTLTCSRCEGKKRLTMCYQVSQLQTAEMLRSVHWDSSAPGYMKDKWNPDKPDWKKGFDTSFDGPTLGQKEAEGTIDSFTPGTTGLAGTLTENARAVIDGSRKPEDMGTLGGDLKIHRQQLKVNRVPLALVEYEYKGKTYELVIHLDGGHPGAENSPIQEAREGVVKGIDEMYDGGNPEEALYNVFKYHHMYSSDRSNQTEEERDLQYKKDDLMREKISKGILKHHLAGGVAGGLLAFFFLNNFSLLGSGSGLYAVTGWITALGAGLVAGRLMWKKTLPFISKPGFKFLISFLFGIAVTVILNASWITAMIGWRPSAILSVSFILFLLFWAWDNFDDLWSDVGEFFCYRGHTDHMGRIEVPEKEDLEKYKPSATKSYTYAGISAAICAACVGMVLFAPSMANSAKARLKADGTEVAIKSLKRAAAINPRNVGPWCELAIMYRNESDTKNAEKMVGHARRVDETLTEAWLLDNAKKDNRTAHALLSELYIARGQKEKSLELDKIQTTGTKQKKPSTPVTPPGKQSPAPSGGDTKKSIPPPPEDKKALRDKVVGTYQVKRSGRLWHAMQLLKDGKADLERFQIVGGKLSDVKYTGSGTWKIEDGEIHLVSEGLDNGGNPIALTQVYRINKDGSLTEIAFMQGDGKREDLPKEQQITLKKIN